MSNQLPWTELRPWNGSQNKAFEQLCVQFAAHEDVPAGSVFVPKDAPDAGVEGYWCLPDKAEWGFQAKFFTSSPTANQWAQIDESVETALQKHPQLTQYTVCLPIDRQDPRIPNPVSEHPDHQVPAQYVGSSATKQQLPLRAQLRL